MKAMELCKRAKADYMDFKALTDDCRLWNFCLKVLGDAGRMNEIIEKDKNGIPPEATLLKMYRKRYPQAASLGSGTEKQSLGRLLDYVFGRTFSYDKDVHPVKIGLMGVASGALYKQRSYSVAAVE